MTKKHELKTDPAVFQALSIGAKTFEIRKDDRGFEVGDTLILRETVSPGHLMAHGAKLEYTGRQEQRKVTHILRGPTYGLTEGWVIMSVDSPRIAELERELDASRAAEAHQIALREKAQNRNDELVAHCNRLIIALDNVLSEVGTREHEDLSDDERSALAVLEATPAASLSRRDALKQVAAMRHVAKWLSGEIEEGCIGLDLGGEISGPTGCSDADKCRVAGERIFREAARIWECKFVLEAQQ